MIGIVGWAAEVRVAMARTKWKAAKDPLFRGDSAGGVALPEPTADRSLVRHILYLGGRGRPTPYISTSEAVIVALRFAGPNGRVYKSYPKVWQAAGIKHRPKSELVLLLRGRGKGDAVWPSAFEVAQARAYVEESVEHLADCRDLDDLDSPTLKQTISQLFR